jgi:hypothetical protein
MPIALAPGREREIVAATLAEDGDDAVGELQSEIAVVRLLAGCWKCNVGRWKLTDGCAVRPFC